ncbi:hypothetical protein P8452_56931 [Trifolium repens]|nr:hypothetical protein P8452_54126 [Trifolium repens]WJX73113.1 hypothetical protein P8452_56931 [Trifolium repens]
MFLKSKSQKFLKPKSLHASDLRFLSSHLKSQIPNGYTNFLFSYFRILVITYKAIYPSFGFSNHLLSKDHTICIPWIHHSSQFISLCWCWNKKKKIYATSGRSCCVNA